MIIPSDIQDTCLLIKYNYTQSGDTLVGLSWIYTVIIPGDCYSKYYIWYLSEYHTEAWPLLTNIPQSQLQSICNISSTLNMLHILAVLHLLCLILGILGTYYTYTIFVIVVVGKWYILGILGTECWG